MVQLEDLPNVEDVLAKQLRSVGITSREELKLVGSQAAWLRIYKRDASACINRLLALECVVQGVKKACWTVTERRN